MSSNLIQIKDDTDDVREAAKTISLAFSSDPLIRWLRPRGRPWGELDHRSLKWQCRRVREAVHEHVMVRLVPAYGVVKYAGKSKSVAIDTNTVLGDEDAKFGVVAMLFHPSGISSFSIRRWLGRFKVWLLNMIDPVEDEGSSPERVSIMMNSHDLAIEALRKQVHPQHLWYLEIIAVRPSLHGQGLGGQLMRSIIETYGQYPIALECTDESNLGFYRKYGFEEIKRIRLEDTQKNFAADMGVTLVMMLRTASSQ